MPARIASDGVLNFTGAPASMTEPKSGERTPERMFTIVDLPAPFSPTIAWTAPPISSTVTPSSAAIDPNRLVTSSRPATELGTAHLPSPRIEPDREHDQKARDHRLEVGRNSGKVEPVP